MSTSRTGAAIAAVLVILLAMQVLAHGVLVAAMQELAAAQASVFLVQGRVAAEGAVRGALGFPLKLDPDSVFLGEQRLLHATRAGRTHASVTAERLSAESWLLLGTGRVDGWPGSVGRARLAWALQPLGRVASFRAVVHRGDSGAGQPAGEVTTDVLPDSMALSPVCAPWFAALDSVVTTGTLEAFASDSTDALQLGLLDRETLVARAADEPSDSVTPNPLARGGRCEDEVEHNWGDPRSPTASCGDHFVLRARRGNLRMVGGSGQGVLLVTGDLVMEAGADFRGIVLVGGALHLANDSRLQGLARVGGTVALDPAARIVGSSCWAVRSLDAVQDRLALPIPYPEWGWLATVR